MSIFMGFYNYLGFELSHLREKIYIGHVYGV